MSRKPKAAPEPQDPPKKRGPGRPPTGLQKASISVSLDVDLVG